MVPCSSAAAAVAHCSQVQEGPKDFIKFQAHVLNEQAMLELGLLRGVRSLAEADRTSPPRMWLRIIGARASFVGERGGFQPFNLQAL